MNTKRDGLNGMRPFYEVLRSMGYHTLAAKHGAPIRPAPTVDVDHRHGASVSANGTWAAKATYYVWGSRKWD